MGFTVSDVPPGNPDKIVKSVLSAAKWVSARDKTAILRCYKDGGPRSARWQPIPCVVKFRRRNNSIAVIVDGVRVSSINAAYSIRDRRLSMLDEMHNHGVWCGAQEHR